MNKLISVIIPIYNVESYLRKCLDSVINQTYENLEIICINDCSCDASLNIIEKYAVEDNRIKIIDFKEHKGVSVARNAGIDIATGEYIYFLDSDDWIEYDYLEKMAEIAGNNEVDIIINNNILTEFENKTEQYLHPSEKTLKTDTILDTGSNIVNLFWVVWNRLYKTNFIKKNNLKFPEGYVNEDLFYHYACLGIIDSIYYFKGSAYHYSDRNDSISKKYKDEGAEYIIIYNLIYDFYKENNLLDKKIKIYSTMPSFNIKDERVYSVYKSYFDKTINYIKNHSEIYNELDLYFSNNVANSKNYEEYISKFPKSATISFLRRVK